jgi:hypothetical protein
LAFFAVKSNAKGRKEGAKSTQHCSLIHQHPIKGEPYNAKRQKAQTPQNGHPQAQETPAEDEAQEEESVAWEE